MRRAQPCQGLAAAESAGAGGPTALGQFLFTHGPKSINTGLFIALLNKLVRRARRTGKRIMLVLDKGGCFTPSYAPAPP